MQYLKQSTAVTLKIGPFLDDTDGKTTETALTIAQADVRLSKNGGNIAQKTEATSCTHDELGIYGCPIDATDTATLGRLQLWVHESGALPIWHEFLVIPANVYDSLFSTDKLQVDVTQLLGIAWLTPGVAGTPDVNAKLLGGIAQTGNDVGADVNDILTDTGTTLDALIKDVPTVAEFEARSILAADYVVVGDTIAGVTAVSNDVGITQAGADKVWGTAARALTDKAGFALSAATITAIWEKNISAFAGAGYAGTYLKNLYDNQGNWLTATGFSTHTAANVWTAAGRELSTPANYKADVSLLALEATLTAMKGATFAGATDSLEAIRDRGDAAWVTGAGGSDRLLMVDTTIATLASQTSFTLTAGSDDDDAYNNATIVIEDASTATQKAIGLISNYVGATKTVTLKYDPGIFTIAVTDKVYILAENALKATLANMQLNVAPDGDVAGNVDGAVASVTADVGITQAGADKVRASICVTGDPADSIGKILHEIYVNRLTSARAGYFDNLSAGAVALASGVDLTKIHGVALTETINGYLAAAFVKLFDVATPLLVSSEVMRGTDNAALAASYTATRAGYLDNINNTNLATIADISTLTATEIAYLNANISSRSSHAASAVWSVGTRALTDKAGFALSTAGILAIWHQLTANIVTANTIGKLLKDDINATISSRSSHDAAAIWSAGSRALSTPNDYKADVSALALEATLTAIKGATFDTGTDSLEAIRNQGDSAWVTATGFSTHTAANVWAAVNRALSTPADYKADVSTLALEATLSDIKGTGFVKDTHSLPQCLTATGFATQNPPSQVLNDYKADVSLLALEATLTAMKGATFATATDSLEALRNRGDAAWITGAGGDATEAKQDSIIAYVDELETRLSAVRAGYIDNLSAGAVALEATLTAIKGSGWIDETLKAIKDVIDTIGGEVGPGALSCTWTQKDDEENPMDNCQIWICTDEAGTNVIAGTLLTNASGQATFMLDAGTYYVFREKGGFNFTNPQTWIVS